VILKKDKLLHRLFLQREQRDLLKQVSLQNFKFNVFSFKLQTASQMVQRMNKLSRGFIVANSVFKIILKNR